MARIRFALASLLLATACSAAHADPQIASARSPQRVALAIAPARLRAPYDVQILRDDGTALPTYGQRDRFYVQGSVDERYVIRISNPTARRVEAVVSVDGLDVIDGENGDLGKRGYVVPPYGETRIEGFRTSEADVATFRFSSVGGSYAGLKGKARNVGVIAVALFEERADPEEQEQIIVTGGVPPLAPRPTYRNDDDASAGADESRAEAPRGATANADRRAPAKDGARARKAAPPPASESVGAAGAPRSIAPSDSYRDMAPEPELDRPSHERLGLGTEFGEQRYSAARYTRFVRAPGRPVAIAELRYNDAAGLMALGIHVQPLPDDGELMTRETADPFPGDRFARAPR